MRCFGRMVSFPLFLLILVVTPVAFWAFSLQRVVLSPQTYKTAMQAQNLYNDLLPALVENLAASSETDPQLKAGLKSLLSNMTVEDWTAVSRSLLPPTWLQTQLEGTIDRLFDWIGGTSVAPGIRLELEEIKTRLTSPDARSAAAIVVPKLRPCTANQTAAIKNAPPDQGLDKLPVCSPGEPDLRQVVIDRVSATLNALGANLPVRWDLSEQLRKLDVGPVAGAPAGQQAQGHNVTEFDLAQFRAFIWLLSRLTVLLFLIPLGLLSLIVLIGIRSGKQFFRWTGWGLIVSGILTLLPVPFLPTLALGVAGGQQGNVQPGFGESGRLIGSMLSGMVHSILSSLSMAVLIQVAIAIGLGFVAVVIAVLLPQPEPELTRQDVRREEQQLAQAMSQQSPVPLPTSEQSRSAPRSMGSTGSTPVLPRPTESPTTLAPSEPPEPDA
jgi:hypothetical protein